MARDHIDKRYARTVKIEDLCRALTELPPRYRVAVLLRDIRGLSTKEVSAWLHVKPQTVKSRVHRARLALRRELADLDPRVPA